MFLSCEKKLKHDKEDAEEYPTTGENCTIITISITIRMPMNDLDFADDIMLLSSTRHQMQNKTERID